MAWVLRTRGEEKEGKGKVREGNKKKYIYMGERSMNVRLRRRIA